MINIVVLLAFAICQVYGDADVVAVAPPVAVVGSPIVTSRSSQYFAQNHNTLAAPVISTAAVPTIPVAPIEPVAVEPIAKLTSSAKLRSVVRTARLEAASPVASAVRLDDVAPVAPVAPVTTFVSLPPQAASSSQFTRFAQYAVSPYIATASFSTNTGPLVVNPAVAQLFARSPFPVPVASLAQPLAPVQPVSPQQPTTSENPAVQQPNPDSESVDIEAAKIRALPQNNIQESRAQALNSEAQQNLVRLQQQLRLQNERLIGGNGLSQSETVETRARPSKNKVQASRSAAPGVLMSGQQQQPLQHPYRY